MVMVLISHLIIVHSNYGKAGIMVTKKQQFNEGNCPDNWTGEDINLVLTDMVSIEEIRVYALK